MVCLFKQILCTTRKPNYFRTFYSNFEYHNLSILPVVHAVSRCAYHYELDINRLFVFILIFCSNLWITGQNCYEQLHSLCSLRECLVFHLNGYIESISLSLFIVNAIKMRVYVCLCFIYVVTLHQIILIRQATRYRILQQITLVCYHTIIDHFHGLLYAHFSRQSLKSDYSNSFQLLDIHLLTWISFSE